MSKQFERNVIKFLEMLHYSEEMGSTGKFKKKYCKTNLGYNHLIDYLERNDLIIKKKLEGVSVLQMTDKGLEFLQERKKEKRQEEFNKIIAITASILTLMGISNFLIS